MLPTIEISSIIISFSSCGNLICGQTLIAGRTSPVFLSITDAVFMVIPSNECLLLLLQ